MLTSQSLGQASLRSEKFATVQVPALVEISKQALQDGQCVVIGLQTTGEARTAELVSEQGTELDDFVSGPKVLLREQLQPSSSWLGTCSHRLAPEAHQLHTHTGCKMASRG